MGKIVKRSRDVSEKGSAGVEFLFKKNKIDWLRGEASIEKAGAVKVKAADGKEETHTAAKILIATGCVARPMPGLPFIGKTVIGSKEAMALEKQPKSMVIIGEDDDDLAFSRGGPDAARVREALEKSRWRREQAAEILGVSPRTLYRWMKRLGL